MTEYLSKEWIQEADAALRTSGMCTEDGERFAVEQRVDEVVFHMVFDGDGARVSIGPAPGPAVVLSQSRDTAVAIARGELSAEEAVLNGLTVVDGDPLALLSHHKVMARANDVFADIRSRTDWG
ncbi:hypothetical protein [Candidatus Poriferisocius sp.]|uniref:hypothetical protein n=1 Tax=Candidatus Poriferisocius sp. TaxID=3101276 RepID=UPI003B525A44